MLLHTYPRYNCPTLVFKHFVLQQTLVYHYFGNYLVNLLFLQQIFQLLSENIKKLACVNKSMERCVFKPWSTTTTVCKKLSDLVCYILEMQCGSLISLTKFMFLTVLHFLAISHIDTKIVIKLYRVTLVRLNIGCRKTVSVVVRLPVCK